MESSDSSLVRLLDPVIGPYCTFDAGEVVRLSGPPEMRMLERVPWRNSLTISNKLGGLDDRWLMYECIEPNA